MAANIFTLPPGVPFLKALARAILNGDLPSPGGAAPDLLKLTNITLLLPTRRATRAPSRRGRSFPTPAGGSNRGC